MFKYIIEKGVNDMNYIERIIMDYMDLFPSNLEGNVIIKIVLNYTKRIEESPLIGNSSQ